ncbi:calcium-binding protein [Eikenella corrodens]|uniref:calcium-binding protein n=1 Tax=Eikenella corrodens TaxID=539 RepID=UPI00129B8257|nr:calcium-binding protein [Eikenella corrodens]
MTNQQQNTNTNPATILEFARLQLAAEVLYDLKNAIPNWEITVDNPNIGNLSFDNLITKKRLQSGNDHNSKFTEADAEEFDKNWEMVAHIANTTTGFSGSLFRAKKDISGTDIKKGDLTISFRSTEFVDDATRDSQATNTFEIADRGWAFGQISDMVRWVKILQERGLIDKPLNVTGYSLGGHLATAFNILQRGKAFNWEDKKRGNQYSLGIKSTYTFNGAGVGRKANKEEMDPELLVDIINQFSDNRQSGKMSGLFKTADGKRYYEMLQNALKERDRGAVDRITDEIEKSITPQDVFLANSVEEKTRVEELDSLKEAVSKAKDIWDEAIRVSKLRTSDWVEGDENKHNRPLETDVKNVAAIDLDYQLAVIQANRKTSSYPKFIGGESGFDNIINDERNQIKESFENFYDIYGDTSPSMVATSQLHYGKTIGVAVENQPLGRGIYLSEVIRKSATNPGNPKLLVDNYDKNNFGDTHSLMLLIDSLSVQKSILQLDKGLTQDNFGRIFRLSSNNNALTDEKVKRVLGQYPDGGIAVVASIIAGTASGGPVGAVIAGGASSLALAGKDLIFDRLGMSWVDDSPEAQGFAEGDVLENIINILAKQLGIKLDINGKTELKGDLNGGSWALIDDHDARDQDGNLVSYTGRNSLQLAIVQINKFIKDNNLEDAFTILPATEANAQAAATDFGHFIALKTLNPFVLTQKPGLSADKQAAVTKIWTTVWAEEYRTWQQDFDARQNQRQPDYYTDRWLEDRQILLTIKSYLDITNQPYQIGLDREPLQKWIENASLSNQFPGFTDRLMSVLDSLKSISDAESGLSYSNTAVRTISGTRDIYWIAKNGRTGIQFGSDDRDELTGSQTADHLYGGGGNDILKGGDGEDHLEGGSGYDILYGGKGKDYLNGGTGYDLYMFKSDEIDDDVIVDPDEGEIRIDDKPLKGVHVPPSDYGRWRDEDGYTYITLNERSDGKGGMIADLQIVTPQNKRLTWKDWRYQKSEKGFSGKNFKLILEADRVDDASYQYMNGDVVAPFKTGTNEYNWNAVSWDYTSGKLIGGVEAKGFHDVLRGNAARNTIHGLSGNDAIDGGDGDDILYGDDGHDLITGGRGSDRIYGGRGDDYIFGTSYLQNYVYWTDTNSIGALKQGQSYTYQNGQVWGVIPYYNNNHMQYVSGAQIDYRKDLSNSAGDFLVGGEGHDTIYGSHENDWIYGDDVYEELDQLTNQDDTLYGLGGSDYIFGGIGNDTLYGDGHLDKNLFGYIPDGMHGNDHLYGGVGNDKLYGQLGSDYLFGGDGFDLLVGGTDINTTEELDQDEKDFLFGGSGYDLLIGNAGDDYLDGEAEGGRLYGGAGNDELISGGEYRELAYSILPDGDSIPYSNIIENELYGGSGNDILYASGSSIMDGGSDNDIYLFDENAWYMGAKYTILPDISGNDTIYFQSLRFDQIQVSLEEGNILTLKYGQGVISIQNYYDIEQVIFAGNERIPMETLIELAMQQAVSQLGNDSTKSQPVLRQAGSVGDDTLIAPTETGYLFGGAGSDTYVIKHSFKRITISDFQIGDSEINKLVFEQLGSSDVLFHMVRDDLVISNKATGGRVTIAGYFDERTVGYGVDEIIFSDQISLNKKEVQLRLSSATEFADQLIVSDEGGELNGLGGDDYLWGSVGNDILNGGSGNDVLHGGRGHNTYVFEGNFGQDIIRNPIVSTYSTKEPYEYDYQLNEKNFERNQKNELLQFTSLRKDEVGFHRKGKNLLVYQLHGNNQVLIEQFFSGVNNRIYTFQFADGVKVTDAEIPKLLITTNQAPQVKGELPTQRVTASHEWSYTLPDNLFIDPDQDSLTYQIKSFGGKLLPKWLQFDPNTRTLHGVPSEEETVQMYVSAIDPEGVSASLLFTLEILPENPASTPKSILNGDNENNLLNGTGRRDRINGYDGNDQLYGNDGDDILDAGSGDDILEGGRGNDTLIGGPGFDTLDGGEGVDTFVFGQKFGWDVIRNEYIHPKSEKDIIHFTEGWVLSDFDFIRDGNDLKIKAKNWTGQVTVSDFFRENSLLAYNIEKVIFNDGTQIDSATIKSWTYQATNNNDTLYAYPEDTEPLFGLDGDDLMFGSSINDTLYGGNGNDSLSGGYGNDILYGENDGDSLRGDGGDDILIGGSGDDLLYGGDGNDTYVFNRGFGKDVIYNSSDNINKYFDIIRFEDGQKLSDFKIYRNRYDDDLIIESKNTDDQLKISDYFKNYANSASTIDRIIFSDGVELDVDAVKELVLQGSNQNDVLRSYPSDAKLSGLGGDDYIYGNDGNDELLGGDGDDHLSGGSGDDYLHGGVGNDHISGDSGNDILVGSTGDDYLIGGNGYDTYIFGRNFGKDYIDNSSYQEFGSSEIYTDTIQFKDGWKYSDFSFAYSFLGELIIASKKSNDQIKIYNYANNSSPYSNYAIDSIIFDDGVIMDSATINSMRKEQSFEEIDTKKYEKNIKEKLYGTQDDDNLEIGLEHDTIMDSGNGNDTLWGNSGNDLLLGGSGDDMLNGGHGNDILIGGTGADSLYGDDGVDLYVFGKGHGQDTVSDHTEPDGQGNILKFEGARMADVHFIRSEYDLIVKAYGGGDQVTLRTYFTDQSSQSSQYFKFVFDDGVIDNFDYNKYVANANNLIQAMATFSNNSGSNLNSTGTIPNPVNPLLVATSM